MSRKARMRVVGRLDLASRMTEGTVIIDRDAGLFTVRPLGRRRTYTLPLSTVADMVCQRIIKAEIFTKRITKAKAQKEKRDAAQARSNFRRKLKLVP